MLRALVPSFVADVIWPEQRQVWKHHPTSYLDGLRGLASFIVFICHYTEVAHVRLIPTYGLNTDQSPSSWLQLPFIRIVFSGRPMVHIFFVISGFVLSYKPLKAIHAGNLEKCHTTLASSVFRRPIRLFGPCIVSTFLIILLMQSGCLNSPLPTFAQQFWDWKNVVFHGITWPWEWDKDLAPGYDIHLWTIPIEFAHSMLLFLVILMLSRVRLNVRRCAVPALGIYCLCCGKWAAFEFIAGLFLAELHILQHASPASKDWDSSQMELSGRLASFFIFRSPRLNSLARTALHVSILTTTLFIGGWPNWAADATPGIRIFNSLTPEPFATRIDNLAPQKFWFGLSAVLAVWSAGELRCVRLFLERNPVAQYAGRVSYAVYIMHGPVLGLFQESVVGKTFQPAQGEPGAEGYVPARAATGIAAFVGGYDTPVQRTVAWALGLVVLAPAVVWAADVFWRLVDNPMVTLGRKVEGWCLDQETEDRPRLPS